MIIFMWAASFSVLGVQWALMEVMHIEFTIQCSDSSDYCQSIKGTPLRPALVGFVQDGNIGDISSRASSGNYGDGAFDRVVQFTIAAAYVGWDIILLLTGMFIFEFMYFMGVPLIFVAGMSVLYGIFLIRAIVGYIRGV
jgi:hypothetical protein